MGRAEHLQWCKDRALEYLEAGNNADAVTSMMSDLRKHPETVVDPSLAMLVMFEIDNPQSVRRWIEGFN